jgi:hypothetical protein
MTRAAHWEDVVSHLTGARTTASVTPPYNVRYALKLRGELLELRDHEFTLYRACGEDTHERTHPELTKRQTQNGVFSGEMAVRRKLC